MTINLDLFCSIDPARPELARPFSQGEFTFATNGHIAVRVAKLPAVRRRQKPDVTEVFAHEFNPRARYRRLPPVAGLGPVTCPRCAGLGSHFHICDWCRGTCRVFPSVRIGRRMFNGRYIALIQDNLTDVHVAPAQKAEGIYPMQFRFTGGDGLLMPWRRSPVESPVIEVT